MELKFCNIDCCTEWEKELGAGEVTTDRRGAVLATRKKNAGSHLEFFDKHVDCNPKRFERCYADACWGTKRYNIRKAREEADTRT
jgi:hypothetical protein